MFSFPPLLTIRRYQKFHGQKMRHTSRVRVLCLELGRKLCLDDGVLIHLATAADLHQIRSDLPGPVLEAVLRHHERYDGSGNPDHLTGERIPFLARIIGVVDSFDELTNRRTPILTLEEAMVRLRLEQHLFDPYILNVFFDLMRDRIP
jgi:HD-GYP domain-containing protein (c-di-GMP phosphodiesterase class II)